MIHFTSYEVIDEKPRVSHLPQIFLCTLRKNYALDQKMVGAFFLVSTSSITMQSLGKIVLRMSAVRAKMWCLFFFCHAPSLAGSAFQGCVV